MAKIGLFTRVLPLIQLKLPRLVLESFDRAHRCPKHRTETQFYNPLCHQYAEQQTPPN